MVIFEGEPHCPAVGVKVYTLAPTKEVLIIPGFHVPAIGGILVDVGSKIPGVSPGQ